jgi:large subunit ribosomal protein L23
MSKIHKFAVLRRPLVTEKSTALQEQRRYVFEVAPSANKHEIKESVEAAFGVKVQKVNTMNVRGKTKRFGPKVSQMRSWKKAIVTVSPGDSISIFEGV